MPFEFCYYQGGGDVPKISDFVMLDAISLTEGDMVEISSSEADLGETASTTLFGVAAETVDNADDGESIKVIDGWNAVFAIVDASARVAGAALDLNSSYDGVTTNSNSDLVVVANSSATEKTLVMISPIKHIFYTAT